MGSRFFLISRSLLVLFLCDAASTDAQKYSGQSNIQLLRGRDISTLTLEHAGGYRSFSQFGFADIFHVPGDDLNIYAEWYPKVSIRSFDERSSPVLKDILLGAGVNWLLNQEFAVVLAGPVWQFNLFAFELFQLETYFYRQLDDKEHDYNGTFQVTCSWSLPFSVSDNWKFLTRGFIDYIGDRGPGVFQVVSQPQLLLDIGNLWNTPDKLYAGSEWNYWKNMNGISGERRSIFQAEIIWFL